MKWSRIVRLAARRPLVTAVGAAVALTLAACGSTPGDGGATSAASANPAAAAATTETMSEVTSSSESSIEMPMSSESSAAAPESTESAMSSAPADPGPAASVPAAPIANAVTITMPGMSYDVSGPLKPGIGSITLVNADDVAHMMSVGRLKDGVDLAQVTDALGKGEDAMTALLADSPDAAYGTPDLLGAGQSETVTGLDFKPGTYLLICFVTAADGTPHWQMGMVGTLTVEGEPATEKPADKGTITIDDNAITLPDGFDGHGTYLVTNSGKKGHSISLAKLDSGTALAQYAGYVGLSMATGKPIDGGGGTLVGGIDALTPGQSAYLTLDLARGHYGYVSAADMQGPQLPGQAGEFDVS